MKTITVVSLVGALAFAVPALADDASSAPSTPSAQRQCRTERSDMGLVTFRQTYGTNHNRSNAFGKCVSKRARATAAAKEQAHGNAAAQCKSERTADPAAFKSKWGSNRNGANAYGKCVSQTAKTLAAQQVKSDVRATVNAAHSCRVERRADADAFAAKYGSRRNAFGKCVARTVKAQQDNSDGQQT